jgi:quinol monooxygenase YgiN
MIKPGIFVRLEARTGMEPALAKFLEAGQALAEAEPATITWYALKFGPSTFGIFDTFPDEAGRQAHLAGRIAAALMAQAGELLSEPPAIEMVDVLAAKLPGKPA